MKSGSKLLNYSESHLFGVEMAFSEFERYQNLIEDFLLKEAIEFRGSYDEGKIAKTAKEAGEFFRPAWSSLAAPVSFDPAQVSASDHHLPSSNLRFQSGAKKTTNHIYLLFRTSHLSL